MMTPDDILRSVFRDAVQAVRPDRLVASRNWMNSCGRTIEGYGRVIVIAIGKCALPFAQSMERELDDRISDGIAVVPHGYPSALPADLPLPQRMRVLEAGHPIPDAAGVRASEEVLALAEGAGRDDLVIVCVSGGGSALLPAPPRGISIADVSRLTRDLLRSGAPIGEVNTVRRAVSRIAGGGLATAAWPAEVVGLIVSDVPGDDPSTVAGGPVSTTPTSAGEALDVLSHYGIEAPGSVVRFLQQGDPVQKSSAVVLVVGSNSDLLHAAAISAESHGLGCVVHAGPLTGFARDTGPRIVREAVHGPLMHILGGETTVRVTGSGTGGRNQELALAAAIEIDTGGQPLTLLAAGSDGLDGPTRAAGAICGSTTVQTGRELGMSAESFLAENNSWEFFERVGGHVITGPTHVNVMDLVVTIRTPGL